MESWFAYILVCRTCWSVCFLAKGFHAVLFLSPPPPSPSPHLRLPPSPSFLECVCGCLYIAFAFASRCYVAYGVLLVVGGWWVRVCRVFGCQGFLPRFFSLF